MLITLELALQAEDAGYAGEWCTARDEGALFSNPDLRGGLAYQELGIRHTHLKIRRNVLMVSSKHPGWKGFAVGHDDLLPVACAPIHETILAWCGPEDGWLTLKHEGGEWCLAGYGCLTFSPLGWRPLPRDPAEARHA